MKDPYFVLGVPNDASLDEVKKAYRDLVKDYFDASGEVLSDGNRDRLKEINDAYDEIIQGMRKKTVPDEFEELSYGGYSASSEFPDVRRLISSGRFDDAQQILDGVQVSARNAEWHYLKGLIFYKRGWLDDAESFFLQACKLDPTNEEYNNAYGNLRMQGEGIYGGYNRSVPRGCAVCDPCDLCSSLICMDCCCECFGGDLIPCC